MARYKIIKSFDIDDGELDGIPPHECFVLGYELSIVDGLIALGVEIDRPVHAANQGRIEKSCIKSGRQYKLKWSLDDSSESWMQLWVQAETPNTEGSNDG